MENLSVESAGSFELSENIIIRRIIDGEKELFEILMRRCNQTLNRAVRSYLKDDNDVNDVMQETYIKAYTKLNQFHFSSTFSTWLIRIGINEALHSLRKKKKQEGLFDEQVVNVRKSFEPSSIFDMTPEKRIIQKEMSIILEQAIDELPTKYKIVYMLREVEGMENDEIAACLNLTNTNVKVRVHRAKAQLREKLYHLSKVSEIFEFGNTKCDDLVERVMRSI